MELKYVESERFDLRTGLQVGTGSVSSLEERK